MLANSTTNTSEHWPTLSNPEMPGQHRNPICLQA